MGRMGQGRDCLRMGSELLKQCCHGELALLELVSLEAAHPLVVHNGAVVAGAWVAVAFLQACCQAYVVRVVFKKVMAW